MFPDFFVRAVKTVFIIVFFLFSGQGPFCSKLVLVSVFSSKIQNLAMKIQFRILDFFGRRPVFLLFLFCFGSGILTTTILRIFIGH